MAKARAFISFAAEDAWARDLFIGQGKHPDTPWEIADWSRHEPFTERWKTQMRQRIKQCHVVIQLVSKNTPRAEGAIWEVNCAKEEGIPAFGVWVTQDAQNVVPSCFSASNIIKWTWDGVAKTIDKALAARR